MQALFLAAWAWLLVILHARSGPKEAKYKTRGRAIPSTNKNSTQYKKHERTGVQVLMCPTVSKPLHPVLSKSQSAHALLQVVAVIRPQDCCEALLNLVMDRSATSPQRRKILLVAIQATFLIRCSLPSQWITRNLQ